MSGPAILLADIGGTFGRFCLWRAGGDGTILTLARAEARDLADLCATALRRFACRIDGAAIAIAAPLEGGQTHMTNADWTIDRAQLNAALACPDVLLLNDFAALAWSLDTLDAQQLTPIAPCAGSVPRRDPTAPRVVFGPGTGLGVAAALGAAGQTHVMVSEGGHLGFAPSDEFEQRLCALAVARHGRASWERVLSGPGLELIDTLARADLAPELPPRGAAAVVAAALAGTCPAASLAVDRFLDLLGGFGGDLALAFRAGSVFVAGGIVPRLRPLISPERLRTRFAAKGRFRDWLAALPLQLVDHPGAALAGAARAFAAHPPHLVPGEAALCTRRN